MIHPTGPEPFETAWAKFLHVYGPSLWFSEAWPTTDGVIPWRVFLLLYDQMNRVAAYNKMNDSQSIALGIAMAFGGNKGPLQSRLKDIVREAYGED